ncbi:MAG: RNA polymerase sigma-70 factor [Bacteroidales bacterium]|nr:RNA polymerase sigma-70 factor [Bacteroidales bacterium]
MSESYSTDNELFTLVTQGDEDAFRSLFEKYYTPLTVFADKYLADIDAAVDVVQSLFISIYERRQELKVVAIKPFLYQSVRNRCLNELKHQKVHSNFAESEIQTTDEAANSTEELIEAAELEVRLMNAIDKLAPQCKRIFQMSRFEGVSNAEIAESLGISKRTVETQISNALQTLRKLLGDLFVTISILFQLF